ncbi:MAG: translocation/assembly module TamB [Nitrospirae bacterium]|nr:MAG: translocation/assembly module TamB [Nitrospirota bacterium]
MENAKRLKRIIYLSLAVLFIGIIIFISRGPYISNALKKIILPELENMSGRKVIAQKIYLNIFPLFVEARGLKFFDEEGNRVLTAERVKGYLGLSGILRKEVILKRVVLIEPEIWTDRKQIDDMIGKVKAYLAIENPKKIKVKAEVIAVRNGGFSFYDVAYNAVITGEKVSGEILLGDVPEMKLNIKTLISNIQDFPEFRSEISGILFFRKDGIDIKDITLKAYGSEMQSEGSYSSEGKGALKAELNLLVDSVKEVFGLKREGRGKIYAKGDIKLGEGPLVVDLKLKGSFYLETLMELLKVEERVEGMVDFDGRMSGPVTDITGSANARLRKGNLFDVDIDDLTCKVSYSNGLMSFKDGKGVLYNGRAEAEVSIELPDVEHYSVWVKFTDVDSPAAFRLIEWDPGLPLGKVKGELYSSDTEFNPTGWFEYENKKTGGNFPGRIRKAKGNFTVQGDVLSLKNIEAGTERSTLWINGAVNITGSQLDLKGKLETVDIADITSPYFNRLRGSGDFTGTITGKFDDPLISGSLNIASASFDDYEFENIAGDFSYRKNYLEIKELSARSKDEQHNIKGDIKFHEAKEIFDIEHPDYRLTGSLRGANIEKLVKIFYKKLPLKGRLDSDFRITGKGPRPEYSGSVAITHATAHDMPIDLVSAGFSYNYKDLNVTKVVVKRGGSLLKGEGRISDGERFYVKASADRLFIKDIGLKGMPADMVLSMKAEGTGTFDNPAVSLSGKLSGGTFEGKSLGDGTINASVRNKNIAVNAVLFNEKMRLKGKAYLDDKLPWSAEVDIASGRYDFLLSGIFKDMPEDLFLNMKGHADLSGDKKHFSASAVISQMTVALFGNSFSNDSDIRIRLENKNIIFSAMTMRSGKASFSVRGNIEPGKEYNLVLEGSSELAPLRGLSQKIGVLRGDADFTLTVIGKWDNPQINGSLNVTTASFGLKDMHQRLSAISGYFYFEDDKIVIQKLSGKLGGGDIDISGIVYLKGLNIKRFYLDAKLHNISTAVSKDFNVNFDGNIFYKGTLESQSITGEVRIKRARYRERVEWKSWLLKAGMMREKPKFEPTRLEKAALNIKIYGDENIVVDNNIANAPFKVDLVLRGTMGRPLLFGRVEATEGKIYFRNNEFRILHASADFADPNRINPVMEIVAQTTVKGYNIKLSLEGQFDRFTLSLVSDPPLEETDILSLLTVGQIGRDVKGLEGGIGAGEAAAFLTGKVQDVFEDRVRNITGLDRVQVDPYVSKATGTVGPRVTASKRLLGDRLYVTYISSIGSSEEQVLRLEYILGKNVSLLGIRDDRGSIGGDIKFRFEFK